jgi:hypothetical protein
MKTSIQTQIEDNGTIRRGSVTYNNEDVLYILQANNLELRAEYEDKITELQTRIFELEKMKSCLAVNPEKFKDFLIQEVENVIEEIRRGVERIDFENIVEEYIDFNISHREIEIRFDSDNISTEIRDVLDNQIIDYSDEKIASFIEDITEIDTYDVTNENNSNQ